MQKLIKPLYQDTADAYMAVFENLVLPDVVGKPKIGDISKEWVLDFASLIFGSLNPENLSRVIREFFLLIPKKNGKSTLSAGIMLTMLIKNWRENAEFVIIAPTINVADNSFRPLCAMIQSNSVLSELLNISYHTKTITHRGTKATLKVLSARQDNVTGLKATGVLIDELWLFGKRRDAEFLFREIKGGFASRKEGFCIYLTTQSDEPPAGVFKDLLTKARAVHDGTIEDKTFYPVLYEFSINEIDKKIHENPDNWAIVNPNIGASVDFDWLKNEYETAKLNGESSLRNFYSKHLNVEVGLALRSNRWIGADYWERNEQSFGLDYLLDNSDVVTVGIDGGGLDDFLGLAVVGRKSDGDLLMWNRAWVIDDVVRDRQLNTNGTALLNYSADGDLVLIENIGDDSRELAEIVYRIYQTGLLFKIGIDPVMVGSIVEDIVSYGIDEEEYVLGIRQGWTLASAIKTLERLLASSSIKVASSPMMRWMVSNAVVDQKGNAIMISKEKSNNKIDALMASFNAIELMSRNPTSRGRMADYLENIIVV